MENQTNNNTKPKGRKGERVALTESAKERLDTWTSELQQSLNGCRVSKGDLVNYLIMSHSPAFSNKEIEELKEKYFDELRFVEWAVKQIKTAKSCGKSVSLSSLLETELPKAAVEKLTVRGALQV